jgi:O-6-methylguanine DNA methyltransferase
MPEIAAAFATLAGPWGPFQVAVTDRGVVAAASDPSRSAFEEVLVRRLGAIRLEDDALRERLEAACRFLLRAFDGEPVDVTAVPVDLMDRPAFDRYVLEAVREVPWGRTASDGEIARRIGAPRAARAVGGAVGRSPITVLIPCHRIIASDGTLGGYGGVGPSERAEALEAKRWLLLREGVTAGVRGG